jgi:hypothetical protein
MTSFPSVRDVLTFTPSELDFGLSLDFRSGLQASRNPIIVMFVGNGRFGKSERKNQILIGQMRQHSPFKSVGGTKPARMGFQYWGPVRLEDIGDIHEITQTSSWLTVRDYTASGKQRPH